MRVDESSVSVVPPLVLVTDDEGFIEVSNVLYVIMDESSTSTVPPSFMVNLSFIFRHLPTFHLCTHACTYVRMYVLLQVLPCSVCTFNIDDSLNICYI